MPKFQPNRFTQSQVIKETKSNFWPISVHIARFSANNSRLVEATTVVDGSFEPPSRRIFYVKKSPKSVEYSGSYGPKTIFVVKILCSHLPYAEPKRCKLGERDTLITQRHPRVNVESTKHPG